MRRFLIILILCFFVTPAFAIGHGRGFKYYDKGWFHTDISLPVDVAKNVNLQENNIINISDKKIDLEKLKKGSASVYNVLNLVEWGEGGIFEAAQDGNITKILYVSISKEKIRYGSFTPYFTKYTTTVYGE